MRGYTRTVLLLVGLATSMWDDLAVTAEEEALERFRRALRQQRRARAAEERATKEMHRALADAVRAGVRPRDLIAESGLNSESVRRIAREQGVPPLREATVVSKRKAEAPDT